MNEKITHQTITKEVENTIRAMIIDEKILPGQKINVDSLSKRFGTSKVPIREALKALENEELIVYKSMSGWRVAEISLENFRETMEMQNVLELYIAKNMINQINYSDDGVMHTLDKMEIANDSFYKYALLCEYNRALDENLLFHTLYYSLYWNKSFQNYLRLLWNRDLQFRRIITMAEGYLNNFYEEHKAIKKSISTKDPELLFKSISTHFETVISSSKEVYEKYMAKIGERTNE